MTNTAATYVVRIVTVVDRPALRGATFPVVAVDTKIVEERRCSYAGAVYTYNACLAGEYDFTGEYVRSVQVYQMRPRSSARTVRKLVERTDVGNARAAVSISRDPYLRITAIAAAAERRGNRLTRMSAHWTR